MRWNPSSWDLSNVWLNTHVAFRKYQFAESGCDIFKLDKWAEDYEMNLNYLLVVLNLQLYMAWQTCEASIEQHEVKQL